MNYTPKTMLATLTAVAIDVVAEHEGFTEAVEDAVFTKACHLLAVMHGTAPEKVRVEARSVAKAVVESVSTLLDAPGLEPHAVVQPTGNIYLVS